MPFHQIFQQTEMEIMQELFISEDQSIIKKTKKLLPSLSNYGTIMM